MLSGPDALCSRLLDFQTSLSQPLSGFILLRYQNYCITKELRLSNCENIYDVPVCLNENHSRQENGIYKAKTLCDACKILKELVLNPP